MTDPATPPAPPTPPAGDPPTPPTPPAPPATPPAPTFDPTTLSPEAQAYLAKAKADAEAQARIKARDEAKAEAAKAATDEVTAKLAAALGLAPAAPADPAKLQAEIEALKGTSASDKREIALWKTAAGAGVSTAGLTRLTDSRSFMAKIEKLNPSEDDFATKLAAVVTEAITADPSLKAGTAPAGTPAGDFGNGNGAPAGAAGTDPDDMEAMEKALGFRK